MSSAGRARTMDSRKLMDEAKKSPSSLSKSQLRAANLLCKHVERSAFRDAFNECANAMLIPHMTDFLHRYVAEQEAVIRQLCHEHYAEFLLSVEEYLSFQEGVTKLQQGVVELNRGVRTSGVALKEAVESIQEVRRQRVSIIGAQQVIEYTQTIIALMRKARMQIDAGRYISGCSTLGAVRALIREGCEGVALPFSEQLLDLLHQWSGLAYRNTLSDCAQWLKDNDTFSARLGLTLMEIRMQTNNQSVSIYAPGDQGCMHFPGPAHSTRDTVEWVAELAKGNVAVSKARSGRARKDSAHHHMHHHQHAQSMSGRVRASSDAHMSRWKSTAGGGGGSRLRTGSKDKTDGSKPSAKQRKLKRLQRLEENLIRAVSGALQLGLPSKSSKRDVAPLTPQVASPTSTPRPPAPSSDRGSMVQLPLHGAFAVENISNASGGSMALYRRVADELHSVSLSVLYNAVQVVARLIEGEWSVDASSKSGKPSARKDGLRSWYRMQRTQRIRVIGKSLNQRCPDAIMGYFDPKSRPSPPYASHLPVYHAFAPSLNHYYGHLALLLGFFMFESRMTNITQRDQQSTEVGVDGEYGSNDGTRDDGGYSNTNGSGGRGNGDGEGGRGVEGKDVTNYSLDSDTQVFTQPLVTRAYLLALWGEACTYIGAFVHRILGIWLRQAYLTAPSKPKPPQKPGERKTAGAKSQLARSVMCVAPFLAVKDYTLCFVQSCQIVAHLPDEVRMKGRTGAGMSGSGLRWVVCSYLRDCAELLLGECEAFSHSLFSFESRCFARVTVTSAPVYTREAVELGLADASRNVEFPLTTPFSAYVATFVRAVYVWVRNLCLCVRELSIDDINAAYGFQVLNQGNGTSERKGKVATGSPGGFVSPADWVVTQVNLLLKTHADAMETVLETEKFMTVAQLAQMYANVTAVIGCYPCLAVHLRAWMREYQVLKSSARQSSERSESPFGDRSHSPHTLRLERKNSNNNDLIDPSTVGAGRDVVVCMDATDNSPLVLHRGSFRSVGAQLLSAAQDRFLEDTERLMEQIEFFEWTTTTVCDTPSDYLDDTCMYIDTVFASLAHVPQIKDECYVIAVKMLVQQILEEWQTHPFTQTAVVNLATDLQRLEQFVYHSRIPYLAEGLAPLHEYLALFLSMSPEDVLNAELRKVRFPHVDLAVLDKLMSGMRFPGRFSSGAIDSKRIPVVDPASVRDGYRRITNVKVWDKRAMDTLHKRVRSLQHR